MDGNKKTKIDKEKIEKEIEEEISYIRYFCVGIEDRARDEKVDMDYIEWSFCEIRKSALAIKDKKQILKKELAKEKRKNTLEEKKWERMPKDPVDLPGLVINY